MSMVFKRFLDSRRYGSYKETRNYWEPRMRSFKSRTLKDLATEMGDSSLDFEISGDLHDIVYKLPFDLPDGTACDVDKKIAPLRKVLESELSKILGDSGYVSVKTEREYYNKLDRFERRGVIHNYKPFGPEYIEIQICLKPAMKAVHDNQIPREIKRHISRAIKSMEYVEKIIKDYNSDGRVQIDNLTFVRGGETYRNKKYIEPYTFAKFWKHVRA